MEAPFLCPYRKGADILPPQYARRAFLYPYHHNLIFGIILKKS